LDDEDIFYNCPLSFVGPEIFDFWDRCEYADRTGTARPYDDRAARGIEAERYYLSKYNEWTEASRTRKSGLDELRNLRGAHGRQDRNS
jgi:hypothetical protein